MLRAGHTATELVNRERLTEATTRPASDLDQQQRMLLERTLDLGVWFDIHRPTVRV